METKLCNGSRLFSSSLNLSRRGELMETEANLSDTVAGRSLNLSRRGELMETRKF